MARIENIDFMVDLQLKSIELLRGSISLPAVPELSLNNFNFNISVESKADAPNKFLFIIVSVEIRTEDQNHILGSLAVSCIYSIANFDDVVKIESDGNLNIPQPLVETLNSISISTTRGVMFSTFKGTFLHNAFLPVVDPRSFQRVE
jgi:hypothetical protein